MTPGELELYRNEVIARYREASTVSEGIAAFDKSITIRDEAEMLFLSEIALGLATLNANLEAVGRFAQEKVESLPAGFNPFSLLGRKKT